MRIKLIVTVVLLLASSYVGAEYGGSFPAILIRTPGTNPAAVAARAAFRKPCGVMVRRTPRAKQAQTPRGVCVRASEKG